MYYDPLPGVRYDSAEKTTERKLYLRIQIINQKYLSVTATIQINIKK